MENIRNLSESEVAKVNRVKDEFKEKNSYLERHVADLKKIKETL